MPSTAEVAWAKVRVATMIGCALSILSLLCYLLLGGADAFQPAVTVFGYMPDLGGLGRKSAVQFNGVKVGEVTETALTGLKDQKKIVRIDMAIRRRYLAAIPEDSTLEVTAQNVLGDKFVNVNEGKSPRHLAAGDELIAPPPPNINPADLINGGREILKQVDAVVHDIETGHGNVGNLVKGEAVYDSLLSKITEFQRAIHAVSDRGTPTGRLLYDEAYYDELQAPVKRLSKQLEDLQAGQGTGGKFLTDPAQYNRLRKYMGDLNRALADLNAGKGQNGKLLKDDELYRRISRLVVNLNAEVDALNSGQGALGQLMVNPSLYESLHGSTKALQDTFRAVRENPQKFLGKKVF
jgi:phospholipid/cholesterol/gamma-HCH transport system substrate-binding protein